MRLRCHLEIGLEQAERRGIHTERGNVLVYLIAEHNDSRENDLHWIAETGMPVNTIDHIHHGQEIQFSDMWMREKLGYTRIGN